MKASIISLLALTAASSVLAAPFENHVHHQHKRDVVHVTQTAVVYVDGQGNTVTPSASSSAEPTTSSSAETSSSSSSVETYSSTSTVSSSSTAASTSSSSTSSQSSSTSSSSSSGSSSGISGDLSAYSNPSQEFEDGVHACSSVPTGQGVIAVTWIDGLTGGWTTIMDEDGNTSSECTDGFYCSYACQAGMSKTQWPSQQPSNGMSVGGLLCKNGYLYKTQSSNNYLCEWGSDTATFESEISQDVAICRTDYPGSENMNVPTLLSAGGSAPVAVVNEDSYYNWLGGKTSTQYYVNNAGVSVEDGCLWGTAGSNVGNWAPVVLGAGTTGGTTYLSLIPNPNNEEAPNYNIKIVGDSGASLSGSCKYENGKYNGAGTDGCTVGLTSGTAKFVFY